PAREAVQAGDEELRVGQMAAGERRLLLYESLPERLEPPGKIDIGCFCSLAPLLTPFEDRIGLGAARGALEVLREFLVELEVGLFRQAEGVRHTKLLSAPGVRPIRLGDSYRMRRSCGWARPFPRTGGAPRAHEGVYALSTPSRFFTARVRTLQRPPER